MTTEATSCRKTVQLNKDDVDWFESAYGPNQLSWALAMLLQKFRQAHKVTPDRLAELGAEALKYLIEEQLE